MATHVYTSVAANYLPKARVLALSVKRFHPDFKFHVVLCDRVPDWFVLESEPFDSLIPLQELGLQNSWIFKHTLVELSTGVKGFALEKLLGLPDCGEVLYLDPDIVVLSSLRKLLDEFGGASILLTPHITEPENTIEAILDNEFSVLQHGIYNLGFVGVKNSAEGRRFAQWWAERLHHFCYDDIARGIFTDQRWADLVPAYFSGHKILRDAVYNVCTWNLTHRTVTGSLQEGLQINGEPVVFYHFSGFDSGAQQGMLDKYGHDMPALYELREWYIAECERMGQSELARIPWAYGFFDNGERILSAHRKRYRNRADLQSRFPNPYLTEDLSQSYLHWFNTHEDISPSLDSGQVTDLPVTPEYRVFVIAAACDEAFIDETITRVREQTVNQAAIFFGASPSTLAATSIPAGIQSVAIDLHRYDEMFDEILRRFSDRDALIVRAGAIPPEKWDLRLAWSSVRQPGIATVSPVDERLLDPSGKFRSNGEENLLDRLCYWHRQATDGEIARFSRDCVYVRAAALREILGIEKQFHPSDLLDGSARLRYSHVLATHLSMEWRRPRATDQLLLPDSALSAALTRIRHRIRAHEDTNNAFPAAVVKSMTGPNLHVMHSWGGGLERWVADYCRADREHDNFVLKSVGPWGAFGSALYLYRNIEDAEPLHVWPIDPAIKATDISHPAYDSALAQVLEEHGIRRLIISSLIGHSLDVLRKRVPTIFVCHDYYPFCSALNITFDEVCRSCEPPRLSACVQDNPNNRFFPNIPPSEWLKLRKEFTGAVKEHNVTLVAPSPSVRDNYAQLCPDLARFFQLIPHGTSALESMPLHLEYDVAGPLRVVVLGSLAPHKGGLLLESILPELLHFCEVSLLGCGAYGAAYQENPKITVIPEYERNDLSKRIADLRPHMGLLLSVVPETFSYTLRELQEMRLPVLATNIGSFTDRIENGITGLLCAPEPGAVLGRLKDVAQDRTPLRRIYENLTNLAHRSVEEMLQDYETLYPRDYSARRYFENPEAPQPLPERNLQLFWRTAKNTFTEKDSVVVAPLGRERQIVRLHFVLPAEPIEQFRLDLSSQPGFFFLHELLLRDFQENVLWSWDHKISSLESPLQNDILFLQPDNRDESALLYFEGNDPFLLLPIPPSLLAQMKRGGSVEVTFSLASAEASTDGLVSSVKEAQEENAALIRRVAALMEAAGGYGSDDTRLQQFEMEIRQRDARIHELEKQLVAVQNSISWRLTRPARALAAGMRKMKRLMIHSTGHVSSEQVR